MEEKSYFENIISRILGKIALDKYMNIYIQIMENTDTTINFKGSDPKLFMESMSNLLCYIYKEREIVQKKYKNFNHLDIIIKAFAKNLGYCYKKISAEKLGFELLD